MHMLRRQSRRTASETTPHSEFLRGAGPNRPPLMRSWPTTQALSCVLPSRQPCYPRWHSQSRQPPTMSARWLHSLPLFFHRYSASTTKSASDYPKHLAGWAHRGSENEDDCCDWDWWESGGSRAAPWGGCDGRHASAVYLFYCCGNTFVLLQAAANTIWLFLSRVTL